ncbi:TPA: relaxase/mobilization nuclease domain-containing protein [Legionella pneumophila]|nr:relaxase/mobilization nuclease domain-containing protein [Legionella pneumophila]
MIVRHIPMKVIRKSNFAGLIQYMTNEHGKQERVGEIRITNCQSNEIEWAIHEVQATQELNQRAKGDKTYHLLISFPAGEIPSADVLKDIEQRVCSSVGLGEHQRISVVHYDTDNFHIHVGINKIHPKRYTLHEPYLAYKKLGEIATLLEIEHGLQRVNHIPHKVGSENRADDMEHHAGIGSLLNWIKSECMEQLKAANNWSQFHHVLAQHGLELRVRGSGLVIVDGLGIGVKASSVSRDFSKIKLEKAFGSFENNAPTHSGFIPTKAKKIVVAKVGHNPPPRSQNRLYSLGQLETLSIGQGSHYSLKPIDMKINTSTLYARYQEEHNNAKHHCSLELSRAKARKNQHIEAAKRGGRLKRAVIKLLRGTPVTKKALYALTSQALQSNIEEAQTKYAKERESIYLKYQRSTWADWLKLKALEGDVDALHALRSREVRQNLKGNVVAGLGMQRDEPNLKIKNDNITKTGTVIYRVGTSAIRDDGELINMSRGSSEEGIAAALHMAMNRYGECITVKGSDAFKEQVVTVAAQLKLNLRFDIEQLELQRQHLIKNQKAKEKHHESRRQSDLNGRGTNRGSNENFGSISVINPDSRGTRRKSISGGTPKPYLGRIGQQPPPESKNRLRNLSQLSMVQLSTRGEVLLPSHVPGHLEHQRTQSNDGLRRNVSRPGAVNLISDAADKYIAERELKRQKIADIPKHRRYNKNDEGFVRFAGTRQVDGDILALLKRDKVIIVVPVNEADAQRIKRLSVGSPVALTSNGIVISKGRSR